MSDRFEGRSEGRSEGRGEGRGGDAGGPMRRKSIFRRKTCPLSGPHSPKVDYKNVRLLERFVTERGKIIPCRISAVSAPKQRELAVAIKRARILALLPYCDVSGGAGDRSAA